MGLDMYLIPQFKEDTLEESYDKFNVEIYWRKAYEIDEWFREHGIPYRTPEEIKNNYEVCKWIITRQTLREFLAFCAHNMIDSDENSEPSDLSVQCRMSLQEIATNYQPNTTQWIYYASW